MFKIPSSVKNSFYSAVTFFMTIFILSIAVAAIGSTWTSPATLEVNSGSGLTASAWNALLANFNNLNIRTVPTGAVMAFYGNICPNWWSTADGTTTVKKTDGSSSTLDLRGEFIRGLDTAWVGARGVDTGRTLGSWQGDLFRSHHHGITLDGNAWTAFLRFGSPNATWGISDVGGNHFFTDSFGGSETRPRNIALLYCVKD